MMLRRGAPGREGGRDRSKWLFLTAAGLVLAGVGVWFCVPVANAQTVGVVFPAGSRFADSNAVTIPILPNGGTGTEPSSVQEWKSYGR
jgi:hypothetical protein